MGQGAQEAKAGGRKAAGKRVPQDLGLLLGGAGITGRIAGLVPVPVRVLT